jgi:predicted anti-sigma-YlaC factor YlaD
MSKKYCEKIRISKMAILDGEEPLLSAKQVNEHLESCSECRLMLEQQKQAAELLDGQTRRVFDEDVWSAVAISIKKLVSVERRAVAGLAKPKRLQHTHLFIMLGLFLIAYKIIEVLPGLNISVAIKLVPLAVAFVFFNLIKQNPFVINQNLRYEGDTR